MASSKAKYMRRRRNAVLAAAALALILIIAIIIIIVGITKPSGSGSNLPTATPPATPLPTPINGIGNYNPLSTTPPATTVTPAPTPQGNIMYVTGSTVNVRDKASSSGGVLTQLSKGAAVTVGKLEGDFYEVTLSNGIEGYISKNFLSSQSTNEGPTPTPNTTPSATPDTSKKTTMYVKGNNVNVRDKASSSGKALVSGGLENGYKVTAFTLVGDWYYVEYKTNSYGYIHKDYLTETKPSVSATPATPTPSPTPAPTAISDWTDLGIPNLSWGTTTSSATRNQYKAITLAGQTATLVDTNYTGGHTAYKVKKTTGGFYYIGFVDGVADIYDEPYHIPGTPVQ